MVEFGIPWGIAKSGFQLCGRSFFGPRSAIERFFSFVDWRIRRLWERFPNKSSSGSLFMLG